MCCDFRHEYFINLIVKNSICKLLLCFLHCLRDECQTQDLKSLYRDIGGDVGGGGGGGDSSGCGDGCRVVSGVYVFQSRFCCCFLSTERDGKR